jgi:hypothetical protein
MIQLEGIYVRQPSMKDLARKLDQILRGLEEWKMSNDAAVLNLQKSVTDLTNEVPAINSLLQSYGASFVTLQGQVASLQAQLAAQPPTRS